MSWHGKTSKICPELTCALTLPLTLNSPSLTFARTSRFPSHFLHRLQHAVQPATKSCSKIGTTDRSPSGPLPFRAPSFHSKRWNIKTRLPLTGAVSAPCRERPLLTSGPSPSIILSAISPDSRHHLKDYRCRYELPRADSRRTALGSR